MKKNVLIVGSSGHSKVIIDCFEKENKYKIIGLVDDFRELGEITLDYEIVGKIKDIPLILNNNPGCELFIAIGDNWIRHIVKIEIEKLSSAVLWAKTIHPSVQLGKNVEINEGTAILAGAIVNSNSFIGKFCIINTKASVDHDNQIKDFASLAPNATTGGNVIIGTFSCICISSTLKHKIQIGDHSIIGACSLILSDVANNKLVYGIPGKIIRNIEIGSSYLD